ncbi:hypothetical protein HVL56_000771 [Escherichia coli]|nr:hypothetical protein [Escherichia coli]
MLDFIRDIYSSFRQTSLERVKSPFLGAFVFSWVGFNWQMLAILFFSTKGIEERLKLINKSLDIGDYLLGPICTTALIVTLLPQINKFITWMQDKPNSDTVEMSLASKIRIAELQQSLAESEARKKLADKKEERFIEEGIYSLKEEFEKTKGDLSQRNEDAKMLQEEIRKLEGHLAKAESKFSLEQDSKSQIQSELLIEKESNRTLGDQILKITSELNKLKSDLALSKETYDRTLGAYDELKEQFEITKNSIIANQYRYPYLMEPTSINGPFVLKFNNDAGIALEELNNKLKRQTYDTPHSRSLNAARESP